MEVVPSTTWMSSETLSSVGTVNVLVRFQVRAGGQHGYGYGVVNARNDLIIGLNSAPSPALPPPEWRLSQGLVPYERALTVMDQRVAAIAGGTAPELIWLLE